MVSRSNFRLLLLLVLVVIASARDHIVGGDQGWNPNINYTLWSDNQTFYVNDLISFRYQKNVYNVFEVNETGYDNCSTDGALGNWSSGKDFIPLDHPGVFYFICGNGQCFSGMKVTVVVLPISSNSSEPSGSTPSTGSSASGGAYAVSGRPPVAWMLILVLASWIGIRYGEICSS